MDEVLWIEPRDISDTPGDAEIMAVQMASYVLYKLTGQKFPGFKNTTEWYCYSYTDYSLALSSLYHTLPAHLVHSIIPSKPVDKLLELRSRPVIEVTDVVTAHGTHIDTTILDSQYLIRNDNGAWDIHGGTLVSYKYGQNPPMAGKIACAELARQISYIFTDDVGDCQLNGRIVGNISSMNSQGISYQMIDPQTFLSEGRTGITVVDLFIKAANPSGAHRPARILTQKEPSHGFRRS